MSWNCETEIYYALEKLVQDFPHLNWDFSPDPYVGSDELISHWLGENSEEVMVCAFKGKKIEEHFHRQDFFFIHFAYQGDYDALSSNHNNRITVKEGECYIGQPYNGYAVQLDSNKECIIVGVLIRKETFFREYLSALSADSSMLKFFLEPQKNKYSEDFVHLEIPASSPIWQLLNVMILEYANKTEDSQKILKPLVLSLTMYLSYEYKSKHIPTGTTLIDQIMEYIELNSDSVTLNDVASNFAYHPVYISRLLSKKTGKTFSTLVAESRMRRAKLLLNHTDFSIEKIAAMLGYSNSSNFYKSFKQYYGTSPRKL